MKKDYRYEDLNGSVCCYQHIGSYGQAAIEQNPEIRKFSTPITSWVRMSAADAEQFGAFIAEITNGASSETCEYCRMSN